MLLTGGGRRRTASWTLAATLLGIPGCQASTTRDPSTATSRDPHELCVANIGDASRAVCRALVDHPPFGDRCRSASAVLSDELAPVYRVTVGCAFGPSEFLTEEHDVTLLRLEKRRMSTIWAGRELLQFEPGCVFSDLVKFERDDEALIVTRTTAVINIADKPRDSCPGHDSVQRERIPLEP